MAGYLNTQETARRIAVQRRGTDENVWLFLDHLASELRQAAAAAEADHAAPVGHGLRRSTCWTAAALLDGLGDHVASGVQIMLMMDRWAAR